MTRWSLAVTRQETAASRQTWPSGPLRGYTELEPLAQGGFGDVVLAWHDAPGTLTAIKYPSRDLPAGARFAEMSAVRRRCWPRWMIST